jgi:hypothetical protein
MLIAGAMSTSENKSRRDKTTQYRQSYFASLS